MNSFSTEGGLHSRITGKRQSAEGRAGGSITEATPPEKGGDGDKHWFWDRRKGKAKGKRFRQLHGENESRDTRGKKRQFFQP